MLNEDDYEILKRSFLVYQRHWLKLSSKIVDALSNSLDSYSVELLKNDTLEQRELTINLAKEDKISKIVVDYNEDGALSISQIS